MSTMLSLRSVLLLSLALASPVTAAPHAAPCTPTVITPGVSDASYVPLAGSDDADAPAERSESTSCTKKRCGVFTCAAAATAAATAVVMAAGGGHSVVPAPVIGGAGIGSGPRSGALANITVVGGKEFLPLGAENASDYVGAEKPITLASLMQDLKTNPDTKIDCDTLPAGSDHAIQTSCAQFMAKAAEYVRERDAGEASSAAGFLAAQGQQAGDQAGASAAAARVPSLLAGVFQPYSTDIACDEAGGDFGSDCFFACPQHCTGGKYNVCWRTCVGPVPDYCSGRDPPRRRARARVARRATSHDAPCEAQRRRATSFGFLFLGCRGLCNL